MTSLSDKVARVKELDAKRTQGEWHNTAGNIWFADVGYNVYGEPEQFQSLIATTAEPNDDFIAHAPQMAALIAQLWDENQKQREALGTAREALKSVLGAAMFDRPEIHRRIGKEALTAIDNVMKGEVV